MLLFSISDGLYYLTFNDENNRIDKIDLFRIKLIDLKVNSILCFIDMHLRLYVANIFYFFNATSF